MSNLAQSLPNLLLIPGTVSWRKALDKKAYSKASQRLERSLKLNPAYTGVKELPKPTKFLGKAKADVAYNTAYLYMGNRVMKYRKMENASELEAEDKKFRRFKRILFPAIDRVLLSF